MRYLVYFEVSTDVGNRLDFEEEGPGKIIGYVVNRFKPEVMYTEAGTRNVFMVADLDETQMTELMLIAVSYTHLRAHETDSYLVCRLLLETNKSTVKLYNNKKHKK